MNDYVTGAAIRTLREKQHLTQAQLAERISVSDKTVSKWETGRGFPDVSLLEPLAAALRVSVPELLSGEQIENVNRAANMRRSRLYVCPVCGNVLHATGGAMISCCGVTLPPLEAEQADEAHEIAVEDIEHELYVSAVHPMTKQHYLSFAAYCADDRFELVALLPRGKRRSAFFPPRPRHSLLVLQPPRTFRKARVTFARRKPPDFPIIPRFSVCFYQLLNFLRISSKKLSKNR